MSTLRKILTKSEDGSIQIETSGQGDGLCEVHIEVDEQPVVLDEHVFINTVVEYGIERGILAKPRQRKTTKARKPRKDRGTSRTQPPPPEDPGEPLPLAAAGEVA